MVRSNAATVEEYLNELAPDRREQIEAVRNVVLDKLPGRLRRIHELGHDLVGNPP